MPAPQQIRALPEEANLESSPASGAPAPWASPAGIAPLRPGAASASGPERGPAECSEAADGPGHTAAGAAHRARFGPIALSVADRSIQAWRWRASDGAAIADECGLGVHRAGRCWELAAHASSTGTPIELPETGWLVVDGPCTFAFSDAAFAQWYDTVRQPRAGAQARALDAAALEDGFD